MKPNFLSANKNYSAVNIGKLSDVKNYSLIHPKLGIEIKGKVFVKEATNATGTEISFTTLAPKSDIGYFHIHTKDEETYIILRGTGMFQIDDDYFPIEEGSVVRVAPEGARNIYNSSDEEMLFVCIQSKANSLEEHTTDDGKRVQKDAIYRL